MKNALMLCLLSIAPGIALSQTARAVDQCSACHDLLGSNEAALFKGDVHRTMGITCAGCHGGNSTSDDMEAAMDTTQGFIGAPHGDAIIGVCARCHSNEEIMRNQFHSSLPLHQREQLEKSVHGGLSINGKERIAQCTTCHGAHGILRVSNPRAPVNPLNVPKTCARCHADAAYMRLYNPALAVDQLEKYRTSIHGQRNAAGDTNVAECASCHGSHDILHVTDVKSRVYATKIPATCAHCHSDKERMKAYGIPTDQMEKFSTSVHGVALLEKGDIGAPSCNDCHGNHGAVPPGVESISKVCGTCHALNASLFASSPHKTAFDRKNLPECETCHGNHAIARASDALVGVTPTALCSRCHKAEAADSGYVVAKEMRALIDTLQAADSSASMLVSEAEQKGMEISDAKFRLREVRQARLESRTMVHSFDENKFAGVITKGVAVAVSVQQEAAAAVDEYFFRRWGMAVSTLIISIVAVSLYLTIRRIEKRQNAAR
jgi:predicted CXXCH cytochrome family protein